MDYGFLHLEVSTGGRRANDGTTADGASRRQGALHPPPAAPTLDDEKAATYSRHLPVIPAEAGIQGPTPRCWIPAFAGMTGIRRDDEDTAG
jgi:hypothetical protein